MASSDRLSPSDFAARLVAWYHQGHRDLPWRRTDDPYRIWLSEIMLQQTRAQTAIGYYQRFLERFPTVEELARSQEADVLAVWSGLGYYERARNLRRAAQRIVEAGAFPREYDAIRALPGVGEYTAAAIASIAFGLPHVVVDGNVLRVVARVENDPADIGSTRTRQRFREVAQQWLDEGEPGQFNQALMELGATVCLPKNPLCLLCPVASDCRAAAEATVDQLPVKRRRVEPVAIEDLLLVVRKNGRILLRQREPDARRMAGFWELPTRDQLPHARIGRRLGAFRHTITHHHYTFGVAEASEATARRPFRWHEARQLAAIPLSTTARKALKMAGVIEK